LTTLQSHQRTPCPTHLETTHMSLNHFVAYALDFALAGALLAGFFGAVHATTAINAALALYAVGFVRAALS
jgi:hypothetical protein